MPKKGELVPRKPDPNRRVELEEAVIDYVLAHGIGDLSTRPLADALGLSTFALVYHFGSKDDLIDMAMTRIKGRERAMAARWMEEIGEASVPAIMRWYWTQWCLPEELAAYHRLFFEICGLSLQHPTQFPTFLERGALPWLPFIRDVALRQGSSDDEADVIASLVVATLTGALLVLRTTGERIVTTRAVNAAADSLELQMSSK